MTTTRDDIDMDAPAAVALRVAMARAGGMSGAELARRLGKPGKAGEQWVRRRTHGQSAPTTEDLTAIAAALGCRVRDLLPPEAS